MRGSRFAVILRASGGQGLLPLDPVTVLNCVLPWPLHPADLLPLRGGTQWPEWRAVQDGNGSLGQWP